MLSGKKHSLMSHVIFFSFNILEIRPLEKRRTDHRFPGAKDTRDKKRYDYHVDVTKRIFMVMESLS